MTESTHTVVKRKILKYLKGLKGGIFCSISDRYTTGIPDIIGIYKGQGVGLEVKTGGGRPSAIQRWILARIKACGGISGVVRSVEDAEKVMEEVK